MVNKLRIGTEVLLLNPFLELFPDDPAGISPVLGLAYLAAYLREKKVTVSILDLAAEGINNSKTLRGKKRIGLSERKIKEKIRQFSPKIVGITCQSTLHAKEAHEVARIVKEENKHILVVMGGAHPSALSENVLKDKNVDVVVRGEGEATFWDIAKNFLERNEFSGVLGISFRRKGEIIHNPPRPFIKNLNEIPFPARDLLPMGIYFRNASRGTNYNLHEKVITMITSRGCPGNCTYCAVKTVWGRQWRGRSPENVVDEIEKVIKDLQAKEIHFLDDSISVDKKRLEGICDEIIKRKISINWTTPNGIAVWLLDKNLLLKMKKAGCYRLTFGLESGNKEILNNFIGKDYDYKKAREIISFASNIGLWTLGTFILGFPEETEEQIKDTIKFAVSTDLDFATFYIANPFPGTQMYEIYRKKRLLPKTGAYEIVRGCRTLNFSHQELTRLQGEAFRHFMVSRIKKPYLLLRKLKIRQNWLYFFRLMKNSLHFFSARPVQEKGIAALWKKD